MAQMKDFHKAGRSREHLIVFVRYPVPGKTKTRLVGQLGREGAAVLQDAMTRHTLAQVTAFLETPGTEAEIRFAGGERTEMAEKYGHQWNYVAQGNGDLGQRLCRAFQQAFSSGVTKVVVIGTDCPEITAASLTTAFDALRKHDLVLGPAVDGGFYLLGLRRPRTSLFAGIAWGTDAVLHQILDTAERLRLSIRLLAPLHDVDRPEDLSVWEAAVGAWSKTHRMAKSQEGSDHQNG
jgi:uncharacterized protein